MARPANPQMRDEILKAAAAIIEGCGPDCVTMREVAENIGYSPTTIYLYFKDKRAVLRASVHGAFEELREACEMSAVGPRALDKVRQRGRAYVVWGLMHPGHYRLMFEASDELPFEDEDLEALRASLASGAVVIREAIAAGELLPGTDADALDRAVWAALHGATSLAISRRLVPGMAALAAPAVVDAATRTADMLVDRLLGPVVAPPAG